MARVLAHAQKDAHLYKNFVDVKDRDSLVFHKLMTDPRYESLRDKYLDGELPVLEQPRCSGPAIPIQWTPDLMLNRIDSRLRRVVIKAGTNSQPAFLVMKRLEDHVMRLFTGSDAPGEDLTDLLLAVPTLRTLADSVHTCQFYFHPNSPTGGFHRLLLHAICQFHGLRVSSRTVDVEIGEHRQARALTVTGGIARDDIFRLVDCLSEGISANDDA